MPEETKSTIIAHQLEQMILNKEYEAGEALPSQRDLATRFNASPRSVREAFNSLEVKGLVTVVQGKRTIVNETSLDRFIESLSFSLLNEMEIDKKLLMDLLQVRITIEVAASRELSRDLGRKKTVNQLAKILTELKDMNEISRGYYGSDIAEKDMDFHRVIINSNDNQILSSIHESLSPLILKYLKMVTYTQEEMTKRLDRYSYLVEGFQSGRTDLVVALTLVILNDTKSKCELLDLN